jgi:hypothetical protein
MVKLPATNWTPRALHRRGALTVEVAAAMFVLLVASIPLGYSFVKERELCLIYYHRSVATQIVDGEMEVLAAGEWRSMPEGQHDYPVQARASRNLPPGRFIVTRSGERLKLEWVPEKKGTGGPVLREALVQ